MRQDPRYRRAYAHRCIECSRSVFEHDVILTRISAKGEPWAGVCNDDNAFECAAIVESHHSREAAA